MVTDPRHPPWGQRIRRFTTETWLFAAYGIIVLLGLIAGFALGFILGFVFSAGAVILSTKLGPTTAPLLAAAILLLISTILVLIVTLLLKRRLVVEPKPQRTHSILDLGSARKGGLVFWVHGSVTEPIDGPEPTPKSPRQE